MKKYIISRLFQTIPMLLGITVITFFIMRLSPGKPTDSMTDMNAKVSWESKQRLAKLYDLDKPLAVQYGKWLRRVVTLDFGVSYKDSRPVLKKIAERLPATLLLNIVSLALIFLCAIPIGIVSAVKHNTWVDKCFTVFVFIGFSVPTFWVALLCMVFFGIYLGWLPISGLFSVNFDELSLWGKLLDMSKHLILPVCVSAFGALAGLSRYMRSSMLEVLHQDYIKTARAKGLSETAVIYKHALRNALLPVITILGLSLPDLIGGGFIFETIFAYPGMGRLGFEAILARDYPTIMGIGVIAALLTLLGNLLADVLYSYADPRIRYK